LSAAGPSGGTFAASVGTGGVFVTNTSAAMNVGTVAGTDGVIADGGDVSIATSGDLTGARPVSTATAGPDAGPATLSGNGLINVFAAVSGSTALVQGGSGADTFNVNLAAGTSAQMEFDGRDDSDTFNVTPSAGTTFTVHGNTPPPPASPGDTLSVDL